MNNGIIASLIFTIIAVGLIVSAYGAYKESPIMAWVGGYMVGSGVMLTVIFATNG